MGALLNLEGSYTHPKSSIDVLGVPNCGQYLLMSLPIIHCVMQTVAFTFEIFQATNPAFGDLEMKVELQSFSENQEDKSYTLPIWIFWYRPSDQIVESITQKGMKAALLIYLYEKPSIVASSILEDSQIFSFKLSHPIDENLEEGMKSLTYRLCDWLRSGSL